jgi:3-keto-L-gulonate-6-phosphate decarboxylase
MPEPQLQIAFDDATRPELFRGIAASIAGGADYVEIGTPLLKRYGCTVVQEVRRLVERSLLYVDVKMIDFPHLELSEVLDAGADQVSALAFATDAALTEAVSLTKAYGGAIAVSTMGYPLPLLKGRLQQIQSLGLSTFIAHGAGTNMTDAFDDASQKARAISGYTSD